MMDFLTPNIAHAESLNAFIGNVDNQIINPLISLLFALAIVYFLFGAFEFIVNGANDEKKTAGKSHMMWGIIGLVIMMGVWTILGVVLNTFGISKSEIDPQNSTVNLRNYTP